MFSFPLGRGINQYGSAQAVKRSFNDMATGVPAAKRAAEIPRWDWAAQQQLPSMNAPGANAMHSINIQMVDMTGYDAEALYGHPIFSVREKSAESCSAYTLDGLNAYLLAASSKIALDDDVKKWVRKVLAEHEVRLVGFFESFNKDVHQIKGTRTFAIVVGGLHEIRVPVAQKLNTNEWQHLFFEAKAASAEEVQMALAARGRTASISFAVTGMTVYLRARFKSVLPSRDTAFGAGHIAHVRTPYVDPGATAIAAACAGPRSGYVHGLGLHIRPTWPRAQLYA